MVDVVDIQDFAFIGRWRYNPVQKNYNDESREEQEDSINDYFSSIRELYAK